MKVVAIGRIGTYTGEQDKSGSSSHNGFNQLMLYSATSTLVYLIVGGERSAIGRRGDSPGSTKSENLRLSMLKRRRFNSWIGGTARSFLGDRSEASIY
jgi:hypothetical protein